GAVAQRGARRAQTRPDTARGPGRPDRAGARSRRERPSPGAGRLEEGVRGAAEGRRSRAEGARHAPRRLGARARQPAAHDQEGQLLQRRGRRLPDDGYRATMSQPAAGRALLDMNRYQWTVLFAAWLGWGFDVFDGLLFNYVAPNCVPTLLGLPIGSAAAKAATLKWGGILTSILLLGWSAGGILFGQIAD